MKGEAKNTKRDVLICFAVKEEARPFLACSVSRRVRILITGMGGKNAERAYRKILESGRPEIVLSCGFAGGLNPELVTGDVVFSAEHEFPFKTELYKHGAKPGIFFCAERVAVSAAEKRVLRLHTGADAVEMESEVIRRICVEQKIPSATIRVISDAALEDMPLDFNKLMSSEYELSLSKIVLAVLMNPRKIPALLTLRKTTQAAAQNLSRVLESLPI